MASTLTIDAMHQVAVSTSDINRSTEFYREALGLKLIAVTIEQDPELVFRDEQGQFGAAGEEEWMAFFRDPDGNLLALASRKKT